MHVRSTSRPNQVERCRQGMPVRATSRQIELNGVARICRLRLHPDRTELSGVDRVCWLRLHPDQTDALKVQTMVTFKKTASLKPSWPKTLLRDERSGEETVRKFYILSCSKTRCVWHSTSSVQFCLKATLNDMSLLLLLLGLRTVPPSWTITSLRFFLRRFAFFRRGLFSGSSSVRPWCWTVLTPEACMQSLKSCFCPEVSLSNRGWPLGFPHWG